MEELATENTQLLQQLEKRFGSKIIENERKLLQLKRSTPWLYTHSEAWDKVFNGVDEAMAAAQDGQVTSRGFEDGIITLTPKP